VNSEHETVEQMNKALSALEVVLTVTQQTEYSEYNVVFSYITSCLYYTAVM